MLDEREYPDKICPLYKASNPKYEDETLCDKQDCAWWDVNDGGCVMTSLPMVAHYLFLLAEDSAYE